MLGAELSATKVVAQPSPKVVDPANAGLAADQGLEASGISALRFTGQGILSADQGLIDASTPFCNGPVAALFYKEGTAEAGQSLGKALVPEWILQGQGQNDRMFEAACEMGDSGSNARRPFARQPGGPGPESRRRSAVERGWRCRCVGTLWPPAVCRARRRTCPDAERADNDSEHPRPWGHNGPDPETTRPA